MITRFCYGGYNIAFEIHHNNYGGWLNYLTLWIDDRFVKIWVRDVPGYAVTITKKSCGAHDGAVGLFNFISRCVRDNFMMCYVLKIVRTFGDIDI